MHIFCSTLYVAFNGSYRLECRFIALVMILITGYKDLKVTDFKSNNFIAFLATIL